MLLVSILSVLKTLTNQILESYHPVPLYVFFTHSKSFASWVEGTYFMNLSHLFCLSIESTFYSNSFPCVHCLGDIDNENEILEWLVSQLEKDEIEDVTDEMLDKLIKEGKTLAVLFCELFISLQGI